jgi:hypothetical protein
MIEGKFREIIDLSGWQREALEAALLLFPGEDFSELAVAGSYVMDAHGAAFFPSGLFDADAGLPKVFIGEKLRELCSQKDVIFIIVHELRHFIQFKKNMIIYHDDLDGLFTQWRDGTRVPQQTQNVFAAIDHASYFQLPWEADANGYAHHTMGCYIPENMMLAESVKYCTIPEEFL